jgi:transcriptional regulator of acetoin/glycerol metabolism
MPTNPWLAIDAATPPALRARELRREWEQFLREGWVDDVRSPVAESWRRSREAGVTPAGSWSAPVAAERDEALARWEDHPLRQVAPLIRDCLGAIAAESEHLIIVSDAAGVLLQLDGNPRVRSLAADSINLAEGALWSESGAGTNAIGTALAADHAMQVFAGEHFVEVVQAWTCSAAPVHDPETGDLIGVIDMTGLERNVHPHSLSVAMTTARVVEGHLRARLQQRDDRLRARYHGRITGAAGRRALVTPGGRLVAEDSRGWLRGVRLDLPPGGGELILPSGERAVAEPLPSAEAFIVRELGVRRPARRRRREQLRMLAEEQNALRRLATAAVHNVPPAEILTAVAEEIGPLLGADDAAVTRFEPDGTATVLAGSARWAGDLSVGMRVQLDDSLAITAVSRTGRPARVNARDYGEAPGPIEADRGDAGQCSTIASPIFVQGRLWGAMVASTIREPLPTEIEQRMANFTELVGVVIANAESRAELTASRARVVAAGDEARRRIQRDLHDGAQQRLVSTIVALKLARRALADTDASGDAVALVDEALEQAQGANKELRELAHGILPTALSSGGLRGGIDALASRVHLPVAVKVTAQRFPEALEATAYFIVVEALTNALRHASASSVQIEAVADGAVLRLAVRDDGVGGARTDGSSGLLGLSDRAAALNGELRVDSPPGQGTLVAATLPIPARPPAKAAGRTA